MSILDTLATKLANFWVSMAEKDLKTLLDERNALPRMAQIAILDAERRHAAELKAIQRHYQHEEIRLTYFVQKAEHQLDCLLDEIKTHTKSKVIDLRSAA